METNRRVQQESTKNPLKSGRNEKNLRNVKGNCCCCSSNNLCKMKANKLYGVLDPARSIVAIFFGDCMLMQRDYQTYRLCKLSIAEIQIYRLLLLFLCITFKLKSNKLKTLRWRFLYTRLQDYYKTDFRGF